MRSMSNARLPQAAVDLEAVVVLPAERHARRLDRADRAVLEPHQRRRRIVHGDAARLLRVVEQRPGLDERLQVAGHLADLADEEAREVDGVRGDVAEGAGARLLLVEPPDQRDLRVGDPVLEIGAAIVADLAELAVLDQLLRQHDRGRAAVVVADHVGHAGLGDGGEHALGFRDRVAERLLAEDRLAGARRGDRDLGVRVAGRADVDEVDVLAVDDLFPVGRRLLPAVARAPRP